MNTPQRTAPKELDFHGRRMEAPPRFTDFSLVTRVSLTGTEIRDVPDWVRLCKGIQELALGRNLLLSLPDWIGELSSLKHLYCHDNALKALPDSIGRLPLLEITLGNNVCREVPRILRRCKALQRLEFSGNRLTVIPEWIAELQRLERLEFPDNHLAHIPRQIGSLNRLQILLLQDNQLVSLPDSIGSLRRLATLYLHHNRLHSLPESLLRLTNLESITLQGNPALGIPTEILGREEEIDLQVRGKNTANKAQQVLDYYFASEGGKGRPLREVKLILVGRGEVGKSSLADVLQGEKFVRNKSRTEGISISNWAVKLADGTATILLWDFGGQEIMHGTHQFFLTQRSLYVVMVDGRHDRGKQDAEYWLKLVRAFGGDSPVLVLLNRQNENPFDVDRQYLADKYGVKLEHFFRTDCSMPTKIKPVKDAILKSARLMLSTEARFPAKNWSVKTRLAEMKSRGEDYLSDEDYTRICVANGVSSSAEQQELLARLADLGTVVSFPADIKLAELTLLNPEWVTDGIYRVITNEPLREQRHGQLTLSELRSILPKDRWPKPRHLRYLIDLMEKFELCFRVVGEDDTVLVPELLPDETPALADWDPKKCLVFIYSYIVLPHGVLPRFITRTHMLSHGRERWRTGVVVGDDSAEALIKADFDINRLSVWIRGGHTDARRALLKVIRHHFDVIHNRIKDLDPEQLIGMPGFPDVTVSFTDLVMDERDGKDTTRVTINGERYDTKIADMLNGVESPAERQRTRRRFQRHRGVELRFEAGSKAQFGNQFMDQHNKQNISGGVFNAPVGVNQTFTNCYNRLPQIQSDGIRDLLTKLVASVEAIHPHLEDAKIQRKAERQLELLTEEAAQPEPNKGQIELSGKGLVEAAKTCAEMAGPVVTATKAVLAFFGVSMP